MTLTITTRAIGKKYSLTGVQLEHIRKSLTRLGYIQKDKQGGPQVYMHLKDLPTDAAAVRQEYSDHYYKSDPVSALGDALSEIENLASEMTDWRDNMGQYDGLSATQKYEEVQTAADTLEEQQSELEDIQSGLGDLDGMEDIEIVARPPFDPYFYGYSMGRARRLSNALADLNAATEGIELYRAKDDTSSEDSETAEDLFNRIGDVISELEGVDFPTL